jgi:transcription elongation factor SPT6
MGDLEDIKETPEEIAATFTCAMFETSQDVLKGARHMVHLSLFVTFFSSPFYPETAYF